MLQSNFKSPVRSPDHTYTGHIVNVAAMRLLLASADDDRHGWMSDSAGLAVAGACAFAATVISGVQV